MLCYIHNRVTTHTGLNQFCPSSLGEVEVSESKTSDLNYAYAAPCYSVNMVKLAHGIRFQFKELPTQVYATLVPG